MSLVGLESNIIKSMKEKIKIISKVFLGILIALFILTLTIKELIYVNAYRDCIEQLSYVGVNKTFVCVGILNGRSPTQ